MKKILFSIYFLMVAFFLYFYLVVSISGALTAKGNDYGMDGILAKLGGDYRRADSLKALQDHYWQKADNTIKLIPKIIRP